MKNILITGGSGFIGSHLCDLLIEKGNKVFCLDNFITGRKENISHLISNENFTLIEHDIRKPLQIEESIDQIYNLASPASPIDFKKIPLDILEINSLGTKNVLDFAVEKNAVFLQASTSEVYGDPKEHPQKETYLGDVNPIGPRSCYDEGKRFSESLVVNYKKIKNTDVKIARIFNTYGPKMRPDDGRVVPNFIIQCLENKPITIHGSGKQTRSFCYVSDLIEGLHSLMTSSESDPVNIGNQDTELTIMQLAEKIKELTNSTSEIIFKELLENDPLRRRPDILKAQNELSWNPLIGIDEGLIKTISYFK